MNLWDRQQGEKTLWYDRFFKYYLPIGPERSLTAAFNAWLEAKGKGGQKRSPTGSWRRCSEQYNWIERAMAWDDFQRQKQKEALQAEIDEMVKRHIAEARVMQNIAVQRLGVLQKDPSELSATEVRRFMVDAIKLEREARGLPDEKVAVTDSAGNDLGGNFIIVIKGDGSREKKLDD